jgi:hypothetical protein
MMDKFWYNNDDLTNRNIHNIVNEGTLIKDVQTLKAYTLTVYAYKMFCFSSIIIFTEHKGKQTKLLVSIRNENRSSNVQIITE